MDFCDENHENVRVAPKETVPTAEEKQIDPLNSSSRERVEQPTFSASGIYGRDPFSLWRVGFYLLMAYNWNKSVLGPLDGSFNQIATYDHAEWVYDFAPKTEEAVTKLRIFGTMAALLSSFNNTATIIFAALSGQLVFTAITMFINHYYLFFLLSTIMAIICNCRKDNFRYKAAWLHVLRGQIVVVYFFASLWKLDIDWINGTIVKGIFLSFEEQGVNRGVPWKKIHAAFPDVFFYVAISGLLLDFMLFLVLMFLPPGHKMQSIAFIFHGFTGYTMSQRIGYSFPAAMIMAGLIFQQLDDINKDQASIGGDVLSHANWLLLQMKPVVSEENKRNTKRLFLPILFLLLQWAIPLRMPIISGGLFKYTGEGYRWSWTMMLHTKASFHSMGLTFMTIRPKCGNSPYPNPLVDKIPSMDPHSFPYEVNLPSNPRLSSTIQTFPRQMPKVANFVSTSLGSNACPLHTSITTSYFSSTNHGPFRRIIDPTSDLLEVYENHANLPYYSKLWYAIIDKAPPEKEFVLSGIGSIEIPLGPRNWEGQRKWEDEITFVDRAACLQADPIRIQMNSFNIEFDSDSNIPFRLKLDLCVYSECKSLYLQKGESLALPLTTQVSIGIDHRRELGETCSQSRKENVVIRLSQLDKHIPANM